MADKNFIVKNGIVVNTAFSANSTQLTFSTINSTSSGILANNTVITLGNSSVNVSINSTSFSGTSANATNLNSQPASYYTNATNITSGTLPYARIPVNVINTTSDFTITGVYTHNANIVIGSAGGLIANGSVGTAGQTLLSNGSSVYWGTGTSGSNQQIQFNDSGVANASSNFTFNKANNTLTIGVSPTYTYANSTTLAFVNSSLTTTVNGSFYSGTANNANNINSKSEANLNVNNALTANSASFLGSASLSTVNTAITSNASAAYTNATSYAASIAGTAYTNATSYAASIAGTAYTNATSFASNASNITSGTLAVARLSTSGINNTGSFTAATITVDAYGRVTAASGSSIVSSFNSRTGSVSLSSGDVTGALGYTPVNKAGDTMTGDLTIYRSGSPTTGVVFLGNSGSRYLYYDGSAYTLNGAALTVGGNISGVTGYFSGDVYAFYSDDRLKKDKISIANALDKVKSLNGFTYVPNELAKELGFEGTDERRVGVSAQEVKAVLPEAIKQIPNHEEYMTVQYDKIVPLLIEAIKDLSAEVEKLKNCNCGCK